MQFSSGKPGSLWRFVPTMQGLEERDLPSVVLGSVAPPPVVVSHTAMPVPHGDTGQHNAIVANPATGERGNAGTGPRADLAGRPLTAWQATATQDHDGNDNDPDHDGDDDDDSSLDNRAPPAVGLPTHADCEAVAEMERCPVAPQATASIIPELDGRVTEAAQPSVARRASAELEHTVAAVLSLAAIEQESSSSSSAMDASHGTEADAQPTPWARYAAAPFGLRTVPERLDPEAVRLALQRFLNELESGTAELLDSSAGRALLPWVCTAACGGMAGAALRRRVQRTRRPMPGLSTYQRSSGLLYPNTGDRT